MYDHIDDVKAKLESNTGIGSLPCTKYMLKAIGEMEKVLRKYYQKTAFPTVYADGMILNPHTKLIIFEDPSWRIPAPMNIRTPVVDVLLKCTITQIPPP